MELRIEAHTVELKGTSYEIGLIQGRFFKNTPMLAHHMQMEGLAPLDMEAAQEAAVMLQRWCPGLDEELAGFAEGAGVQREKLTFYAMSCLRPRCSQLALGPGRMEDGAPLLARNYDFAPGQEDFTLVRTVITGRYAHLGTSTMTFGRDEGINEHGLCVAMSSCGIPIGAMEFMQPPTTKGLIFWVVIRALLENCRTLEEALAMLGEMPIAFNLNMIVMDRSGKAALIEALDGRVVTRPMGEEGLVYATNHALLPELKPPVAMRNSIKREESILEFAKRQKLAEVDVKQLLLAHVDEGGLFNPYYDDFLGTTKSIIMRPEAGTLEICWGGLALNGWRRYDVKETLGAAALPTQLKVGTRAGAETFAFIQLT